MATRTLEIVLAGDAASASRAFRRVEQDAGRMGKSMDREGKRVHGFATITSKGFGRIGVAAGGMAAAGVAGAGLLAKSFVEGATSINESLTKNEVLFGKFAGSVDRFSKRSAQAFGISRQSALEATGTFGNLFTALEIGPRKSAGMSVALTKLAADMASFNNASPEETLEAIRSGLVGETEPLRRFGVNLNDATLRAEALRMGLVKNTKEALEPQTKALAVNSLLFRQTEKAQGDFRRTSDGLANQQRILKAQFADTSAELGGRLMPFALKAVSALNSLFDSSSAGGRVITRLKDAVKVASDWIGGAFSDALAFANKWIDRNRRELETARDAFRNLARAVRFAFEEVVLPVIKKTMERIVPILEGLRDTLSGLVRFVTNVLTGRWSQAWDAITDVVRGVKDTLKAIITGSADVLWTAMKRLGGVLIKGLVAGLKPLAKAVTEAIEDGVSKGVKDAAPGIVDFLGKINPFKPGINRFKQDTGDGLGQIIQNNMPRFGGGLMGARPELGVIAGLGSRFGLGVSSGRRPGAITSSGRRSWHATGEALDLSGPPSAMMGFARYMSQRVGSLAELIYTPLGAWSNGARYTPTGKLAADHYDHVHVAMDVGAPGQGDGIGQAVDAARKAGFRGQSLINAVAIAGAESKYDAEALNPRYPDYSVGMWQINMLAHGKKYGTEAQLKNAYTNARAAWQISNHGRNWSPWSTWPPGEGWLARARAAVSGGGSRRRASGGGGGGAGGGPSVEGPSSRVDMGTGGPALGLARAERRQATAEARDDLSGMIKGLEEERRLKRRRLKLIRKVLKGRLSKARRIRLVNEETQLIGEIGDLTDTIKEYKADRAGGATTISQAEELDAGVAADTGAGGGGDTGAGGGTDNSAAIAELTAAIDRMTRMNEWLVKNQGPALIGAVLAAVNGGIGGQVGLGFQGIRSAPGSVAGL